MQISSNELTDEKYISLSAILKISTVLLWLTFGIFYLLHYLEKFTLYANFHTFILITLFCIFLYIFVNTNNEQYEDSLRLGIGVIILIIFLQRIVFLTIYSTNFEYNFSKMYALKEFNYTIFAFGFLLFICFVAIKIVKLIPFKESETVYTLPSYSKIRNVLYLIAYLSLILSISLGYLLDWRMGTKWEYGWLARLFPNSVYTTMMVLLWVFYEKCLPKKEKIIIFVYFLLNVLFALIQGSRGGIFGLLMVIFYILIVVKGNFRISRKIFILFIVINLILGPMLWILGNAIRYKSSLSNVYKESNLLETISSISYRLGVSTDDFLIEINNWGNKETIESLFTLKNIVKAGINATVPGEIFKDAPFENSGNLWLTIFFNEELGSRIQGTVWSGFGFIYTLFGKWVILYVFLWFLVSSWLFRIIIARKTIFYYLIAVYLFVIFIKEFFINGNLDGFISGVLSTSVWLFIIYLLITIVINTFS